MPKIYEEWRQLKTSSVFEQVMRKIRRAVIFSLDLLLACVYLVALLIQKTPLYRRVGTDRLLLSNRITIRLTAFFDPKIFYTFYEKMFYDNFVSPVFEYVSTMRTDKSKQLQSKRSPKIDAFNSRWQELKPGQEIERAIYALLYSIFDSPPVNVFCYNLPNRFVEVIRFAQEVMSEKFQEKFEVIDLNLFNNESKLGNVKQETRPLSEMGETVTKRFGAGDFFAFGLDDPIPPLGHVEGVFLEVFPKIPKGMRVAVLGVSENRQEDEWIKWNVSSWNAETLLEILIRNTRSLVIEWDSRIIDFSVEEHLQNTPEKQSSFCGRDLLVIRRSVHIENGVEA